MKTTGKLLAASVVIFVLVKNAHGHPGHDGHELTWEFHSHGLWDSPILFAFGVLIVSAVVFRFASRQK